MGRYEDPHQREGSSRALRSLERTQTRSTEKQTEPFGRTAEFPFAITVQRLRQESGSGKGAQFERRASSLYRKMEATLKPGQWGAHAADQNTKGHNLI